METRAVVLMASLVAWWHPCFRMHSQGQIDESEACQCIWKRQGSVLSGQYLDHKGNLADVVGMLKPP